MPPATKTALWPQRDITVFVYGTLRHGQRNQAYLRDAVFLNRHTTAARYTMYHLGLYPAVIAGGTTAIVGELYAITPRTLTSLDRLEEYPTFYTRRRIQTPCGTAWMYLLPAHRAPRKPRIAGDWLLSQST